MTQLSLVEHALCPLDDQASLKPNLMHSAAYFFSDRTGTRCKATARVLCPEGLSAHDEFYLWGLLALVFSQPEPSIEFSATPHYCLRQLGLIEDKYHRGGKTYRLFRSAIERLSAVTYQNDKFYDPMRGEHCQVSFGFLSYRLPLNTDSSRAWTFYINPLFFEICQATGSALAFDLATYRELDAGTRRLYLLLKKMFWKRRSSMQFDVRHLAVNVLGLSAKHETWKLKPKLAACVEKLIAQGILAPPTEGSVKQLFRKLHKGHYSIVLHRGPHFDRATAPASTIDSPLRELLQSVGFEPAAVARILHTYSPKLITEWADITLAARERNGEKFFKKSAQAYFMDSIRHAAAGTRTPPDWWRELRRQEDQRRRRRTTVSSEEALDKYLETEAREAFQTVMQSIFTNLVSSGQDESDARDRARHIARSNLRAQFLREHPEYRSAETISAPIDRDNDE